jgi:hypothetical protein
VSASVCNRPTDRHKRFIQNNVGSAAVLPLGCMCAEVRVMGALAGGWWVVCGGWLVVGGDPK